MAPTLSTNGGTDDTGVIAPHGDPHAEADVAPPLPEEPDPVRTKARHARAPRPHPERAVRVVCHVVGAAPFLLGAIVESARGYLPTGDDAVIAARSWSVLTGHGPLVGQYSADTVRSVHATYDLGPLLYWFLTIPVHLDHQQGVLWGAALLCMVGVALAIEAAWSVRSWMGGAAVAAAVVVLAIAQPEVVLDPAWNPSVGVVWFLATAVLAWAVASGRLGWMPVAVLAGSLAAQCHLQFAVGAAIAVAVAPVAGIAAGGWPPRWRWAWTSGVVLLACWAAPVVQQLTTAPGNLTLIFTPGRPGQDMGTAFGLRAIAAAAGPRPLLFTTWSGNTFYAAAGRISGVPAWAGVALLVALAVAVVGAWGMRRRTLAALALVALVYASAGAWTTAHIPVSFIYTIGYLDRALWVLGPLVWAVTLWSVGALVLGAARRWRPAAPTVVGHGGPGHAGTARTQVGRGWYVGAGVAVVGLLALVGTVLGRDAHGPPMRAAAVASGRVEVLAPQVERLVPRGPVVVTATNNSYPAYMAVTGLMWRLQSAGWRPETGVLFLQLLGGSYNKTPGAPVVTVLLRRDGAVALAPITRVPRPRPRPVG